MSSQSDSVDVSEEVKQFVSGIIAKNGFKETCNIKYYPGSQVGEGYMTKTYGVDISADDDTSLNLFLKCAMDVDDTIPFADVIYAGEIYFYKTIYPTYKKFMESHGVRDGLLNIPVCYGVNEARKFEIVALENLRKKGFTLFDKTTYMNDEHLKFLLQSYAKFHAVSFAMKDQRKEQHDEFCERSPNFIVDFFPKIISSTIKALVEKLDTTEDKDILDRLDNLDTKIYDQIGNINNYSGEYSILIKGDCHINNVMISYENADREHPKDIMLIDWQGMTRASPVHDFAPIFYSVSSKETLDNYKHYLQIYHEELSKRIKELGSDPEVLYPFSVFEKEWIDFGLYSLGRALVSVKRMVTQPKDIPTLEKNEEKRDISDMFVGVSHDEEKYLRRAKYIARHMMDIGIL